MNIAIDTTELIYLVLGPGALLIGALLLRADLRLERRYHALKEELAQTQARCDALQAAWLELRDDRLVTRERTQTLDARLGFLSGQLEQLMLRDAQTGPYLEAVRHAGKGADADTLVERTGVTPVEAELIVSLHRKREALPPANAA